jgi:hypothetical protein
MDASVCIDFDDDLLQAFVAHELVHMLHHDPLLLTSIDYIVTKFLKTRPDYRYRLEYSLEHGCAVDGYVMSFLKDSPLIRQLRYFIEYRADILGCLTSIDAACEAYSFFEGYAAQTPRTSFAFDYFRSNTHPPDSMRAQKLKAVRDEMILAVYEQQKNR